MRSPRRTNSVSAGRLEEEAVLRRQTVDRNARKAGPVAQARPACDFCRCQNVPGESCLVLRGTAPVRTDHLGRLLADARLRHRALPTSMSTTPRKAAGVTLKCRNGQLVEVPVVAHAFFDPANARHRCKWQHPLCFRSCRVAPRTARRCLPARDADRSHGQPRFGLKGGGSAGWLAREACPCLPVNRIGSWRGTRVLRLGNEDILLLAEGARQRARRACKHLAWRNRAQRAIHRGARRAGVDAPLGSAGAASDGAAMRA